MESSIVELWLKPTLTINSNGNGYGNGYGNGNGNGDGDGYGIKSFNNQKVYIIDNVQTIIKSIKGNIAKGFILQSDLSLSPCFIAKGENHFAHGESIQEAVKSLQEKLLESLPIEDRIVKFKEQFSDIKKKYKAIDFYNWHFFLTGSCKMGRDSFIKDKGFNIEKDTFTVLEFINLTKNSYQGNIISQLETSYESSK